jgi:hypothetical protein
MIQLFRFVVGGGWWTLWYLLFYLLTCPVNIAWFEELLGMVRKKETGPGNGAAYIGLVLMSGLPVLVFSCIHLFLSMRQATDSRTTLVIFSVAFLFLVLLWMFWSTAAIAEATYTGFAAYYLGFVSILLVNLYLLWVARHPMKILFFFPAKSSSAF